MLQLFIQYAAPPILTVLGLGAAWLLTQLGRYAVSLRKDSKVMLAIQRATNFAAAIVNDIEATMRPKVVDALKDGKLSPEEAASLKNAALLRLKMMLGEQGLGELTGVVGIFAPSVDTYLSGVIEKQVALLPK